MIVVFRLNYIPAGFFIMTRINLRNDSRQPGQVLV